MTTQDTGEHIPPDDGHEIRKPFREMLFTDIIFSSDMLIDETQMQVAFLIRHEVCLPINAVFRETYFQ